jgi:taurine dioxygenase
MPAISVRPLSNAVGAEIAGARISADMSDDDFAAIEAALHRHLVVVIRAQTTTPEGFVAFSKRFGTPEPHVINQFHHSVDPNILILSNRKNDKGENIGLADGGSYFHSDYSYLDVPARCTMLYGIEIPPIEAGTTFANQRQAYADLPDATKARIDGLICRHHYGNRDVPDENQRTAASKLSAEQKDRVSWVRHPLVRRHPHTGARSLYAVSGSSYGVEGMDDAAGVALLDELKAHATQPKYCHQPTYKAGDIVIWDNCSLLHKAPLIDQSLPRTLWRITVKERGPTL